MVERLYRALWEEGKNIDDADVLEAEAAALRASSSRSATVPTMVYWPSRPEFGANMMKNCELAEFGSLERAIPTMPRLNGTFENSAGRFGYFDPPVPLKR